MSWLELSSYWHEIQTSASGTGTSSPGQVLVNIAGSVAGDAGLTYDAGTDTLTTGTVAQGVGTAHTFRATAPATLTITGSTNATPIEVTAAAHGLVTGDNVSISGITGNTNANGYFKVTKTGANTFTLQNYSTGASIAGNGAHGGAPVGVAGIVQANIVIVGSGAYNGAPGLQLGSNVAAPGFYTTGSDIGLKTGTTNLVQFTTTSAQFYTSLVVDYPNARLTGPAAATLQLGAANSATPVAQRLKVQDGVGTNIAAAATVIHDGPYGTGTGAVGEFVIQTGAVQASGATPHVPTKRLGIKELHINLQLGDVNIYANNAAALAGGLVAGDLYRTGADPDPVMIVH